MDTANEGFPSIVVVLSWRYDVVMSSIWSSFFRSCRSKHEDEVVTLSESSDVKSVRSARDGDIMRRITDDKTVRREDGESRFEMTHIIQFCIDVDPDVIILSIGGIGVFDIISRNSMMHVILPFLSATPHRLMMGRQMGEKKGHRTKEDWEGGYIHMSMFFALDRHAAVEEIQSRFQTDEKMFAHFGRRERHFQSGQVDEVHVIFRKKALRSRVHRIQSDRLISRLSQSRRVESNVVFSREDVHMLPYQYWISWELESDVVSSWLREHHRAQQIFGGTLVKDFQSAWLLLLTMTMTTQQLLDVGDVSMLSSIAAVMEGMTRDLMSSLRAVRTCR